MMEEKPWSWEWTWEGSATDSRVKLCAKHSAHPWPRSGGVASITGGEAHRGSPSLWILWSGGSWRVHSKSLLELLSNLLAVLNFSPLCWRWSVKTKATLMEFQESALLTLERSSRPQGRSPRGSYSKAKVCIQGSGRQQLPLRPRFSAPERVQTYISEMACCHSPIVTCRKMRSVVPRGPYTVFSL